MLAYPNEKVEVSGIIEEVTPDDGDKYYRLVIGYFDSYMEDKRDDEYIKVVGD